MKRIVVINHSDRFGGNERSTLRRMVCLLDVGHKVVAIVSNSEVRDQYLSLGYKNLRVEFLDNYGKKPFKKAMTQITLKEKPDIIYCSNAAFYFNTIIMGFKLRAKSILYFGGSDFSNVNFKRIFALNFASKILVNSPTAAENFKKRLYYNRDKIQMIINMVEPPKNDSTYRDELGLEGKTVVGFCGGLTSQKGADFIIPVYEQLNSPDTIFLVAGDGVMREDIATQIVEKGLGERIILLGHIKDISKFYNSVDVFFLPSRDEGMANVLLEAMMHKCKIVATDVSGVQYALNHGEFGAIVAPEDINGMVDALQKVISTEFPVDDTKAYIVKHYSKEAFVNKSVEAVLS